MWKTQSLHPKYEKISCPEYNPIRDYIADETGCYFLIRINRDLMCIEVAVANEQHEILCSFAGKSPQSIYHTLLTHQKEDDLWLSSLEHAAYLGKELKKAETALKTGEEYLQE